ncbi:MAG: alpha/beta hydrolase [Campylobacteraceae bacterium]|jgi:alpha-beta hydrolase superfamily lysophospholipase|nr:alpha/beta hydrolase [Campylobacteraceae bacterium]
MRLKRLAIVALGAMGVFVAFGAIFGQSFFYYPKRGESSYTPKSLGLSYENVYFESLDGTKLNGWFISSTIEAKGTVIQVHGNAGKLEDHLDFVSWLPQRGYNLFMFDYRGYGLSEDKKQTPKALMEDTKAAIGYIRGRTPNEKLFILAQSLGGNNAIAAIGSGQRRGIKALLVDSTFFSYKKIADDRLPNGGIFVSDRYSASSFIASVAPIPTLFMHSKGDEVIPYEHTEQLYALANHPKKLIIVPHGRHISALKNIIYQNEAVRFFDENL